MRNTWLMLACAAWLTVCLSPVLAHHGAAAYDSSHVVTIKGTVTDFQFVNPHVLIYLEVKGATGETDAWQGELTSPNRLSRSGWTKRTLKPGDMVTMTGAAAKNGKHTVRISKLVGPDGTALPLSSDTEP